MRRVLLMLLVVVASSLNPMSSSFAITYGNEVENASISYPSVVSIWSGNGWDSRKSFICTGNLITPTVVLTAAHCVLNKSEGFLYVGYGADRLDEVSNYSDVSATWRHPRYSRSLLVNDVGLLLLPSPLPSSEVLQLPSVQAIQSAIKASRGNYEIAGWGVDQNGDSATYLKHTFVNDQTAVAAKTKGWNNNVWLAVGKYNKTEGIYSGACNGDSGGPLYALTGNVKVLIGLTSWGAADCEVGRPSVYTRLSYYLNDIKSGLIQLRVNEKTDNRLPAPSFTSHTSVNGPVNSSDLRAQNTYSCSPGAAGPNDEISSRWYWGTASTKTLSQNRSITLSIADLQANQSPGYFGDSNFVTLTCETLATGPGGLTSIDSASLNVSLSLPAQAVVKVTKNYDTGFSYLQPSTCSSSVDYPGQVIKWIVTSEQGWDSFAKSTYPSDAVVVGVGPTFRYTMQNIPLFSDKILDCVIERSNAIGTILGASESSYTWASTVSYYLEHPGVLPNK